MAFAAPARCSESQPLFRSDLRPGYVRHTEAGSANVAADDPPRRRRRAACDHDRRFHNRGAYRARGQCAVIAVDFGYSEVAPEALNADRLISSFGELPQAIAAVGTQARPAAV